MTPTESRLQLFPTRILVDKLDKGREWNEVLANISEDYAKNKMVHHSSGFKHAIPNHMMNNYSDKELAEYFEIMMATFWKYIDWAAGLKPEDISPPICHMFGNHEVRGQWSIPHAHHANQVVVTYYPKVVRNPEEPHPHAGKMVFHNPRTVQSGFWARKEVLYTPIDIESGTIVAFPACAEHSTFPFFCEGSAKHAIVCNIRFSGMLEGVNPQLQYQTFEALKGLRKN